MRIQYKVLITVGILAPAIFYMLPAHKPCLPENREIAITIDDLPIDNRNFEKIVQSLVVHNAPATGFVIANRINLDSLNQLKQFQKDGFLIGSHTYSHPRLKNTSAEIYIKDIERADKILAPLMPGPKYFRYPHLSQGKWGTKKAVLDYLAKNNYIVAPVTIDSKDFKFNLELFAGKKANNPNFLNQLKERYLSFVWNQTLKAEKRQRCAPTQEILLIHANLINSYFLDDLLQMYEKNGYHFIALNDALGPKAH